MSSSVVEQVLEDALKFQRGIQGFESLLAAAKWLKLPPDIQFQVEDAINQVWMLTQSSSLGFSQLTVSLIKEANTRALPMWFSKYWDFAKIGISRIFMDFRALFCGFQMPAGT